MYAPLRLYSTTFFAVIDIPYERIIIAEPCMSDREMYNAHIQERETQLAGMIRAISARRNEWASHQAAYEWFMKRKPWKDWDPRIVRILAVRFDLHFW